jgi:hypothetical protein
MREKEKESRVSDSWTEYQSLMIDQSNFSFSIFFSVTGRNYNFIVGLSEKKMKRKIINWPWQQPLCGTQMCGHLVTCCWPVIFLFLFSYNYWSTLEFHSDVDPVIIKEKRNTGQSWTRISCDRYCGTLRVVQLLACV